MDNQLNMYEFILPKYKITKPIRLIEFFAGYGSQALALKYLGVPFEHWKICEWAVKSIQAYKDIHFTDKESHLGDCLTKKDLIYILNKLGISSNYNEPMSKEQINRLSEEQLHNIYNNIIITNNLVNIQQVKGEDLEIVDKDKYEYILTYSFPCQDLSLAGKGKGMSDTSTRSGMLWEVERILTECKELGLLPQILLMENVPQVHGVDNVKDFNKWQLRLEELGYKSYWEDLIATDYGIPQTRNRCFMISILGDYAYTFPQRQELKLKLKDMLEDNVNEKFYLNNKQLEDIQHWNSYEKPLENMEKTNKNNISPTLTTRSGAYAAGMILIKNATAKGYLEAKEGDGVDISSRMEYHRGTVQKGKTQTLTTMGGENNGVCVGTYQYAKSDKFMNGKDRLQLGKEVSDTLQTTQKEGVVTIGNYSPSKHNASGIVDQEYSAPTVMENYGTITAIVDKPKVLGGIGEKDSNNNTQWKQQNRIYDNNVGIAVTTCFNPNYVDNQLRIRKLTPRECFRLMGVKDEDFDRVKVNQSDASLYHLAGDSIVVNVLIAIFKELI